MMIGTFWNLCRACPSIPIDKNRSEYRSTYQWYEYTGPRQEVVKQAPQLTSPTKQEESGLTGGIHATFVNLNRNEGIKQSNENTADDSVQPDVNIKRNPISKRKETGTDLKDGVHSQNRLTINPAVRLRSRNGRRDCTPSRRSKSEGPPGTSRKRSYYVAYGSPSPDHAELPEFDTDYVLISNYPDEYEVETATLPVKGPRGNTEYQLQFAWPRSKYSADANDEVKPAVSGSRRSAFMAAATQERLPVPVHKKRFLDADKKEGSTELEPLVDEYGECDNNEEKKENRNQNSNKRIEFHSEYKKQFRPFSQYDYIAGKFLAKDNNVTPSSNLSSDSWYAEVVELRKKAGEYRHRGWGTELVSQHLAEVYNKQIALWEHVSRRSSLSALTLATTTQKPRALTKEEKSKENNRKLGPTRLHETRQASVDRASYLLKKKTEKNEEIKRYSTKLQKDTNSKHGAEKTVLNAHGLSNTTVRAQSASLNGSPKKAASRTASSGSPKKTTISCQSEPRSRPTTLATSAHSRNKRDTSISARKNESLKTKSSQASIKYGDVKPIDGRSANVKTDDLDASPIEYIVKSPPEPTRVKSPEQIMMKSPEPVNWTVPLDTGKTFTVTQNIPDGDIYHHRPPSESKLLHYAHGLLHQTDNQDSTGSHKTDDASISISSCDLHSDKLSDKDGESYMEHMNGVENASFDASFRGGVVKPVSSCDTEKLIPVTSNRQASSEKQPESTSAGEYQETQVSQTTDDTTNATTSAPSSISERMSSAEVLDSARNRFEQFWNKPTFSGKESTM